MRGEGLDEGIRECERECVYDLLSFACVIAYQ